MRTLQAAWVSVDASSEPVADRIQPNSRAGKNTISARGSRVRGTWTSANASELEDERQADAAAAPAPPGREALLEQAEQEAAEEQLLRHRDDDELDRGELQQVEVQRGCVHPRHAEVAVAQPGRGQRPDGLGMARDLVEPEVHRDEDRERDRDGDPGGHEAAVHGIGVKAVVLDDLAAPGPDLHRREQEQHRDRRGPDRSEERQLEVHERHQHGHEDRDDQVRQRRVSAGVRSMDAGQAGASVPIMNLGA